MVIFTLRFLRPVCAKLTLLRYTHKLAEVGILEQPKQQGNYEIGQLFLHRTFGYRGVVLFPWQAKIFDRDASISSTSVSQIQMTDISDTIDSVPINMPTTKSNETDTKNTEETIDNITYKVAQKVVQEKIDIPNSISTSAMDKTVKCYNQTYYQVLIDSRDSQFLTHQSESVTFLGGHQHTRASLYALPGLDYASHDDILPYTTTEEYPFYHELFNRFIHHDPDKTPRFKPKETLRIWQEKNFSWLQLSEVHKETTEGIRVTVIPFYMGCRDSNGIPIYWWRYSIRLENTCPNQLAVQLRERHWRIFSLAGTLETVRGRGVVGQEPLLNKENPVFQYSSHVSLQCPSGHMWGTFKMERQDGYTFECKIPPFALESTKKNSND